MEDVLFKEEHEQHPTMDKQNEGLYKEKQSRFIYCNKNHPEGLHEVKFYTENSIL